MTALHRRFAAVVDNGPASLAVALGQEQVTFAELRQRSDRLAAHLQDIGVGRGDRVVLIADHGIEAIAAFWGILQIGAVTVQLNPKMGDDVLGDVLAECEPSAVLTGEAHLDTARNTWLADLPEVTLRSLADQALWKAVDGPGPAIPTSEDDLAAIVYTSGSTGLPKGVCLTHRNLWTVVEAVIDDLSISPGDSYLMAVPLHYVHGIMQLLIHHLAGAGIHLAKSFVFPQQIVKTLQATGVTGFSGVPFHFNSLIENSNFLEADLPTLRWLTVTGGRLGMDRIKAIREARPTIDFLVAYGQTECAPRATALSPSNVDRKPNSVGSPIKGVRVLIMDDEGRELPDGSVGEVVVAGPNIMTGYWRQPEATKAVIDDCGRLHTGDLGYFDDEGDLFLVGRKSQMIKSAGERIFPQEIEMVLSGADAVLEAVVIGVPDAILGERVEAHLRLDPKSADGSSKALIERFRRRCLEQMPLARAPKRYHLWYEFPCRDNGKVDVLRLAEGVGGQPFVDGNEVKIAAGG